MCKCVANKRPTPSARKSVVRVLSQFHVAYATSGCKRGLGESAVGRAAIYNSVSHMGHPDANAGVPVDGRSSISGRPICSGSRVLVLKSGLESGLAGPSFGWMSRPVPKRRREEDREKRRAQILRAASELYARKGLENVTFGDIARRARLSRPLVYFYFPDQRTLFLETVLRAQEGLRARFEEALASGSTGIEQIESIGRAYARFQKADPAAFQLCVMFDSNPGCVAGAGPVTESLRQSELATHGMCAQAIANGMEDGTIRKDLGRPDRVAVVLWACVHGMAQLGAMRGAALEEMTWMDGDGLLEAGIGLLRGALKQSGG